MLDKLSDSELVSRLQILSGKEREVTLKILQYLIEMERRELFKELGYSSLFEYCTQKLHYSEGSAFRRIAAARCLKTCPELGELLLKGEVSLCTIATARDKLLKKEAPVSSIVGKSKREVERLFAESSIRPREVVKPVVVKESQEEERYALKFSVSKEVYEQFEEARSKLSHSLGKDLSLEAVFSKLLTRYLKKPNIRKSRKSKPGTRYIPSRVREEVLKRDNHCCSYVSPEGKRCTSKSYLQIDHIQPHALGGSSEVSNLRVLCSAHNQFLAKKVFPYKTVALSPVKVTSGELPVARSAGS